MARLLVLMVSIGLADSLNPSTIAPALYLAAGRRAAINVAEFTIAVFVVFLAGGCLIALGPGALLRNLIGDVHVEEEVRYAGEIIAGVLLLIGAAMIWRRRRRMVARGMPGVNPKRRSSALLGAMISAVELPTAFPYFAAIAAVVGSGLGPLRGFALLLVFNLCFVAPLIGIEAVLLFGGEATEQVLGRGRRFLERRWPHMAVILLSVIGLIAVVFGATGLATGIHGNVGRFFRHVRHKFHLHF